MLSLNSGRMVPIKYLDMRVSPPPPPSPRSGKGARFDNKFNTFLVVQRFHHLHSVSFRVLLEKGLKTEFP